MQHAKMRKAQNTQVLANRRGRADFTTGSRFVWHKMGGLGQRHPQASAVLELHEHTFKLPDEMSGQG